MRLGDRVRVIACTCLDADHRGRHGVVVSVDHLYIAHEVLLDEPYPFRHPPELGVCVLPFDLEVITP